MFTPKSKLPRLRAEAYQRRAAVFWTHTMAQRATGWLDARFHAAFREVLLHTCARYRLVCPAYVLMPDHWHLVWLGMEDGAVGAACDQRLATRFLRRYLADALGDVRLQEQAYDHVLREKERERGAFESTVHYIRENPVRAGLAEEWRAWEFGGAMIPGYPDLDTRAEDFWTKFWRIYMRETEGPVSHETGHD